MDTTTYLLKSMLMQVDAFASFTSKGCVFGTAPSSSTTICTKTDANIKEGERATVFRFAPPRPVLLYDAQTTSTIRSDDAVKNRHVIRSDVDPGEDTMCGGCGI